MRDANKLKLDLNESVFFETGYEISKMINISLTPEISIQSFDDYMSIRGVVELTGQYIKENEVSDKPTQKGEEAYQWINKVRNKPNNQVEFSHYFPIDISVPLNRISTVDDVTVKIVSFDYDLLQPDHLQIYSTVHIYGIQDEQPRIKDELIDEAVELDEDFSFEMLPISKESLLDDDSEKRQEELEKQVETEKIEEKNIDKRDKEETVIEVSDTDKVATSAQEKNVLQLVPNQRLSSEIKDEEKQVQKKDAIHQKKKEQEQSESKEVELVTAEEDRKEDVDQLIDEDHDLIRVEDPHHTVDEMTQTDEEQNDVKDVSYLADMFQSDNEKTFTKMRLCIVQNQDTIQSIAERYEIEPLIIINENNLEDDRISEGQLLYIPK